MLKITFMGAGSTAFVKILGDCMLTPALCEAEIALYDIDLQRLAESKAMLDNINANSNRNRAKVVAYSDRKKALKGAKYVINAIQVGGYIPCTVTDFEVPKNGLRQTIGDTIGIGGIFRGLRTIPVLLDFARDMEEVCPDAWFLNYTNPWQYLREPCCRQPDKNHRPVSQRSVMRKRLFDGLGMEDENVSYKIAGINHMAWLLEVKGQGRICTPK